MRIRTHIACWLAAALLSIPNPAEATGQSDGDQEIQEEASEAPSRDFVVRFGAGASWSVFLDPYAMATDDKVMSEFSMSWAPFGLVGEIGADLAIGRNAMFVFHPNLKFFFAKHHLFSFYFEGSCDVMSLDTGVEFGGGGGLGVIFGLTQNLVLEIKAAASVYYLSKESAERFFVRQDAVATNDTKTLMLSPNLSARLLVRF